ncbi:MAG: B12-binding domain-containing radical SAM protein [bacterium]
MPAQKQGQLDLVLVNPGDRRQIYQALGENLSAIETPVWAGLMATFARRRGFSVEVIDSHAEELSAEATAQRVAEMAPRLVAVVVYGHQPSASTQNMTAAGAVCRAVKDLAPDLKVLLVGGHVAALPERTLREERCDFACGGEGPHTLVDLLEALAHEHPDLSKVRGLWFWDGDTPRSTPPAPLVTNVDEEMPGPAWDLLPMTAYRAHNWHCFGHLERQPYAAIYTTLGCPYHCSFCCIQAPFKSGEQVLGYKEAVNSYRFWNPQATVAQIDTLVNTYGVRNIKFADEMFVLNMRHVHGICDLLIERNYGLNIWAYARVDTVRGEGTVEKLKQAGINWLVLGIEAASERVRTDVDKAFPQQEIFDTVERLRAGGINVLGNYIFGLPEDDVTSMQETLDLAQALNCEFANFYSAMAYPGSRLYDIAVQNAWPLPEKWSGYSQHAENTLPLPTKYLSGAEVLRFRDHAFQVYFSDPRYLAMVEQKFGRPTAEHVQTMASRTLTRSALRA